jgi:hypothetical protein
MNNKEFYNALLALRGKYKGRSLWAQLLNGFPQETKRLEKVLGKRFSSEVLYNYLLPNARKTCITCSAGPLKFMTFYDGYRSYCGPACSHGTAEVIEKRVATCRQRLGVDNPSQSKKIKRKKIKTSRKNNGCDYPMQNSRVQALAVTTRLEKTGFEYTTQTKDFQIKRKRTLVGKYGTSCLDAVPEIKERKQNTTMKNYGVLNPSQSPEVHARKLRTGYSTKVVKIGKRIFHLQGYEPQALMYLLSIGVTLNNVEVPEVGIPYECSKTGKSRIYFPDFVLHGPRWDTMLEIKSTWTALLKNESVSRNIHDKHKGVDLVGHKFLLLIMNSDGTYHRHMEYDKVRNDERDFRESILASELNLLV